MKLGNIIPDTAVFHQNKMGGGGLLSNFNLWTLYVRLNIYTGVEYFVSI